MPFVVALDALNAPQRPLHLTAAELSGRRREARSIRGPDEWRTTQGLPIFILSKGDTPSGNAGANGGSPEAEVSRNSCNRIARTSVCHWNAAWWNQMRKLGKGLTGDDQ